MVVVTGATGHIGSYLVRMLLENGEAVRALVPPFEDSAVLEGLGLEIAQGDILDPDSLTRAFEGAEEVYHLAGMISISRKDKEKVHLVNVVGTRNVCDACLRTGVRRLVYTSSIHAMVEPPHGVTFDESSSYDPKLAPGLYGSAKAAAALEVLAAVDRGLDAVIVCPTGVIGPGDSKPSQMGQMFIDVAEGRLRVCLDGAYDFVDIRDVAKGHILACKKGRKGESYILSGERLTVTEIMQTLEEVSGVKAPTCRLPMWLAQAVAPLTPVYYFLTRTEPIFTSDSIYVLTSNSDISSNKARRELGYSPRPLHESIADAVRWLMQAGMLRPSRQNGAA